MVVPSPTASPVRSAASRSICAPRFCSGSLSSTSLAIVTPSSHTMGRPNFFSINTHLEIAFPAASEAALTRTTMECRLRAQSEQIRSALAAAAHRAQVRWSFKTVRGQVTAALRAAASEHDLVAVGRLGWSVGSRLRIGSTARELATSNVPMLLISQLAVPGGVRLLVYYDGSPASKTALFVTANLAAAGAKSVTVLVKAADYEHESAEIQNLLRGRALEV